MNAEYGVKAQKTWKMASAGRCIKELIFVIIQLKRKVRTPNIRNTFYGMIPAYNHRV